MMADGPGGRRWTMDQADQADQADDEGRGGRRRRMEDDEGRGGRRWTIRTMTDDDGR